MRSKREEMCEEYKKMEYHCNRQMLHMVNSSQFVLLMQEMIDQHLNTVQDQRHVVQHLLQVMRAPNKDDIAHLARKVISNENKIDHLDDLVYSLSQSHSCNQQLISTLKAVLQNLRNVTEEEDSKNHRIDNLRNELRDIKSLFQ